VAFLLRHIIKVHNIIIPQVDSTEYIIDNSLSFLFETPENGTFKNGSEIEKFTSDDIYYYTFSKCPKCDITFNNDD